MVLNPEFFFSEFASALWKFILFTKGMNSIATKVYTNINWVGTVYKAQSGL